MSKSIHNIVFRRELCAALALALPASAFAAITPGQGGPSVTPGATPVVNIVAPNNAGVSHNHFEAFNVDSNGVVLNNSIKSVKSQLAGQIDGNADLKGRAASLIITEVTGKTPTALNGALEIAGRKAALVVANPNGISADGGSFINASRVTLTTGTPILDRYGNLGAISVRQGVISVTGKGLDATGAERADLLARSVQINAKLQAKQLRVVTGANFANYQTGWVNPGEASGDAPAVALDVAALGSMYADSITMVGTETGVGVNIAGTVEAAKGSLSMQNEGAVKVAGTASLKAAGAIYLDTGYGERGSSTPDQHGLDVAGKLDASSIVLKSGGALNVAQTSALKAKREVALQSGDDGGYSHYYGRGLRRGYGIDVAGKIEADSILVDSAGAVNIAESGSLKASRNTTLSSGTRGIESAAGGITVAGKVDTGSLYADSADVLNIAKSGELKVKDRANLRAGNAGGYNVNDDYGHDITIAGKVDAGSLSVDSDHALNITDTGVLSARNSLAISAADVDNAGTLNATAGDISIHGARTWWGDASGKFVNTGTISAGGKAMVYDFGDMSVKGTIHTKKGDFLVDERGNELKFDADGHQTKVSDDDDDDYFGHGYSYGYGYGYGGYGYYGW